MIHGFDLEDDLVCEGIIGDGCGGGRIFTIKENALVAYDPQTQSYIVLLKDVINAKRVSKKGCIISIELTNEIISFDISTFQKV